MEFIFYAYARDGLASCSYLHTKRRSLQYSHELLELLKIAAYKTISRDLCLEILVAGTNYLWMSDYIDPKRCRLPCTLFNALI